MNRFMLFLPEHWRRQGTLDTFEPWTLIFLDVVYINLEAKQGKRSWLIVYDVATGGLRIRAVKHKYEIATQWDQIIVEESLHKRKDVRVTVGADGDGVMSLIKEVSRKRGVAYLPIPPYSYVLNMVEGAVNYLKVGVASILLSACTTDGPLTVRDVNAAAEHLCFIHERFVKARVSDNYRGDAPRPSKPMVSEHRSRGASAQARAMGHSGLCLRSEGAKASSRDANLSPHRAGTLLWVPTHVHLCLQVLNGSQHHHPQRAS